MIMEITRAHSILMEELKREPPLPLIEAREVLISCLWVTVYVSARTGCFSGR